MFRNLINKIKRMVNEETGDIVPVENQGRYRSANPWYYAAKLRTDGWSDNAECFLFTEKQLEAARDRALNNPEDLPWCSDDNCRCGTQS